MSDTAGQQTKERFAPKEPVNLAPPKDDVITLEYLSKCDGTPQTPALFTGAKLTNGLIGTNEGFPTLVAIKVCCPAQFSIQ